MYSHPPSVTGDVILFSSSKKKSFNIAMQSALRRKNARHSHVAIAIKQCNAIHAMPGAGVQLEEIRELLLDHGADFIVLRKKSLQDDVDALCLLEDALLFHSRQRYNFLFMTRERWGASFCSELAAKAYDKVGIRISAQKASKTLPMDIFDHLKSHPEWVDVSEAYREFFLDNPDHGAHSLAAKVIRWVEYTNQDMALSQQIFSDRANAIALRAGHATPGLRPSRDYWSNDPWKDSNMAFVAWLFLRAIRSLWRK